MLLRRLVDMKEFKTPQNVDEIKTSAVFAVWCVQTVEKIQMKRLELMFRLEQLAVVILTYTIRLLPNKEVFYKTKFSMNR